jgi:two-component system, OmpR family, sensor histidine kinase ArlS
VKLITKLTLFITLSKLAIVLLFVLILPALVERISYQYNNYYLRQQEKKVFDVIEQNGVDFYLEGEESYGSYTMLKEEYIALEPLDKNYVVDTIETSQRVIEQDTLMYRVLSRTFSYDNRLYLLEIGKTVATIDQYNKPLQRMALYVLSGLILITLIIDLLFTRHLLRPLGEIIRSKLLNRKFPFNDHGSPVKTSTEDFKYLDSSLINLMEQVHEAFEKEREFTSNASHELMTPISILQSKIENLVIDPQVPEELQHRLIDMMKTLNRLKKIVHSLLLISRIENDQFVKKDIINSSTIVKEVIEELDHRLEEKQLQLRLEMVHSKDLHHVNHDLLFQLFYNLINNAIRYNKENGSITIMDSRNTNGSYSIKITDTGIGIPAEEIGSIFNRFKKSKKSSSEGYGLGLAIVKSILVFHDLEVEVDSTEGKGTTFEIIFPSQLLEP